MASELNQRGVAVQGLAPQPIDAPWPNTYGIWAEELKTLQLEHLLAYRWSDTVSYFGAGGSSEQDQLTSPAWNMACLIELPFRNTS